MRVLWRLTIWSFIDGKPGNTPGNVKLLLPPRQSRGNSQCIRLPQCAGFLSLCAGAGRARSKAHPSSNGFGCAAIFNALTVPPQAGFRICAKSLLGIDPANCRVASSDRLALAHGSLALRVSANLSDHSLSTAVLALLTRSCPSRRLRRTAEMGGFPPVRFRAGMR
jgi:hypothetical protein